MPCDHAFKPTHDGNHICRHCGLSIHHVSFRVPNRFISAPATTLDVTAISIGVGFGSLIAASAGLAVMLVQQFGWF
jgi:hypothetical protein